MWCLAVGLVCALGCGGGPTAGPSEPPRTERFVADEPQPGKALYDKYCALCHGDQGQGYAADNANALANADFLATAADSFLRLAIVRGRPGTAMAGYAKRFGGPLGTDEVELIIGYLRSFQQGSGVVLEQRPLGGNAERGKGVYDRLCVGCHGDRGQGNTAPSINNPIFLASASDGFIRYAIEHGRRDTPMPAYAQRLRPQQIDDVTRYVRTLIRNVDTTPPSGEVPPTFATVVINADGPEPLFPPLRDGRYLPADAVKEALDQGARMVLLDARPTSDWLKSHIPGALPVPYYEPRKMVDAIPNDGTWVIAYCGCPHAASGQVMDTLRQMGFANTAVIDEGIFVWMARGYPLTFGAEP